MKVEDVLLTWVRSVSTDIVKVEVVTTINGNTTTVQVGPEVTSFQVAINANSNVSFKIIVYNTDGIPASSESYSFNVDSLEAPQPATGLGHTVIGIRDIPDEPVPPTPPTT